MHLCLQIAVLARDRRFGTSVAATKKKDAMRTLLNVFGGGHDTSSGLTSLPRTSEATVSHNAFRGLGVLAAVRRLLCVCLPRDLGFAGRCADAALG